MKKLWLIGVASLALSTSAMGQPVIGPPFQYGPVCHPVASWTNVNSNVCIKYVCEGGGFHIQCLPAPPLLQRGRVRDCCAKFPPNEATGARADRARRWSFRVGLA